MKTITLFVICLNSQPFFAQVCADPNGIIQVLNTDDEGPGSLRDAIECANNNVGANTIEFNISNQGDYTIYVGSTSGLALPALTDPATIIDGRTQQGYSGSPLIILDGSIPNWGNPINAVWLRSNFCEVYGLEIRNFPDDGIDIRAADFCVIKNNYIHDNGSATDYFTNVPGTGPWEGCGIVLREGSDNNTIAGNVIENNEYCGVIFRNDADNNLIGGPNPQDANSISFNAAGILINENSSSVLIQQNAIFCNDTIGIELLGNANDFIEAPEITQASVNGIGGTAPDGMLIEIFIVNNMNCPNAVCQGGLYIASTTAINGQWFFNPSASGGAPILGGTIITATAHDPQNNTSEFSNCAVVIGTSGCTDQDGNIFVTNTNDSGNGSLREAILCANTTLGANTIRFDIPGDSIHTIFVGSENNEALPALLDLATTIDGTSQPGFGDNGSFEPRIVLDGNQANWNAPINAVWVRGDYCEVYGLEVINFPDDGIDVTNANYVKIGALDKGNVVYNNGDEIDFWPGAPGTGPWNGCGIVFKQGSEYGRVEGNFIGTNYQETIAAGNEFCGLVIQNGGDEHYFANNVIANHKIGIKINDGSIQNTLSQNKLYCNDSIPVSFSGNANLNYPYPSIDSASNLYLSGIANSQDAVEVFINDNTACLSAPCQGNIYLGTAIVVDSIWVLTPPFANGVQLRTNDLITTTATSNTGNTSLYSPCQGIFIVCDLDVSVNTIIHTSCGESNGAFTVDLLGGTGPYVLDIGEGPTSTILFDNLDAGTYTLTVIDDNNCSATTTVLINDSSNPIANSTLINNASCDQSNGSFEVLASSGIPPYTFDIGNGPQNTSLFENLAAGTYTTTISDDFGCTTTSMISISQSGVPQISIGSQENATCEQANGMFTLSVIGGLTPYSYDIGNGPQNNPIFSGLLAGDYTVTVTDAASCPNTIDVTISGSSIPVVSILSSIDASCDQDNGSLNVDVVLGTGPYTYDIGNGPQGSSLFENLAAGMYTITVIDNLGCTGTTSATINQSGTPELSVFDLVNASCEAANGMFSIAALGGVAPYTFDIGDGPQSNSEFTDLLAGTYGVIVIDAVGCITSTTVTLSGSSLPEASILTISNASCDESNGSFSIGVNGGTTPFTYDIGNGAQNSNTFDNLSAGNYTTTVTDDLGCSTTTDVIIIQTGTPLVSVENIMNETCLQGNGSLSVVVSGGNAPYSYDIGNGGQASPDFSGLAAGNYTVTVTDARSCTATTSFEILNDGQLPSASFSYTIEDATITFTNTSQLGDSFLWDFDDGNTTTQVSPVHTYEESGNYEVCMTVSNSCGSDIYCENIIIDVPLVIINLGGTIMKPNGQTVALTEVACTNNPSQTTLLDGDFLFEDQQNGDDYLITPFKDINYRNGVSTYDIYLLNRHILEVEILDSPYKLIAADVDHNENVTTLDLVRLQQLILFVVDTFPNNTSWRFVPSDFVFTDDTNPFLDDFPEEVLLEDVTDEQLTNDFVAIKVGDVNWNSNPASLNDPGGETRFNIEKVSDENGTLVLNVNASNSLKVSAFEMSLFLDAASLEFEGITSITGEAPKVFYNKTNGLLNVSWYDKQGYSIKSTNLTFQLSFKYKGGDWKKAIQLSDKIKARSFDQNGDDSKIVLHFENEKSMNLRAVPNPFRTSSELKFYLDKAESLPIRLYDLNGTILMDQERFFEKGNNQFEVDLSSNPAGVYFYEVKGERGVLVKM